MNIDGLIRRDVPHCSHSRVGSWGPAALLTQVITPSARLKRAPKPTVRVRLFVCGEAQGSCAWSGRCMVTCKGGQFGFRVGGATVPGAATPHALYYRLKVASACSIGCTGAVRWLKQGWTALITYPPARGCLPSIRPRALKHKIYTMKCASYTKGSLVLKVGRGNKKSSIERRYGSCCYVLCHRATRTGSICLKP